MKTSVRNIPQSVDDYITQFPPAVQEQLQILRTAIRKSAPEATETISYSMPAYRGKGILLYFAAHKNHIGFYPTSSGVTEFEAELTKYIHSRGTIQFPFGEKLPLRLIAKIVKFRVKEDEAKFASKKKARSAT